MHSDPSLLSLAIARKPDRLLSVAGYAPLDRCRRQNTGYICRNILLLICQPIGYIFAYKIYLQKHLVVARSTISKIVFLTLLAVMLVGNFKLGEKTS